MRTKLFKTADQFLTRCLLVVGPSLLSAWVATGQTSALSRELPLPTKVELSNNPALVSDWVSHVLADDRQLRASAEGTLVRGAKGSLPLLRRFLDTRNEALHQETFELLRRIGPPAIPLLTDMLQSDRATIRRSAVDVLIDLVPETERVQSLLRRALGDEDSEVARDAARALGALGRKAGPSASALSKTLSHKEPHVRLYAAEALAAIGPQSAGAAASLALAVRDPIPGVRWAACEALGCIGPTAHPAVPQLIEALQDEFLYVRICAAGALGNIGPKASAARAALSEAAKDPALRNEAEWALSRIASTESGDAVRPTLYARRSSAPNLTAAPEIPLAHQSQMSLSPSNPPLDWDPKSGRNIVWSVELGDETFSRPVVAGDSVYVGTDNARHFNPAIREECGVLMAFRATDGKFLWQDQSPRVKRGLGEFLLPSTTSAPYVESDRLYYVTAECQLRCLDLRNLRNCASNPRSGEQLCKDRTATTLVWELDMCARLGVFPHEASNSEVLPVGDFLIVCTSNGQNEGHTRVPSPRAPSLIAVDKRSGQVIWQAAGPGADVLHGQWSSPVAASVNGRIQVLFGGGDGWLRAYDAATGRELWRFDGNPKEARYLPRPGVLSRSSIIASPVFADGRVFIAMGQDPLHGDGPSLVHAISPNGLGDVTSTTTAESGYDCSLSYSGGEGQGEEAVASKALSRSTRSKLLWTSHEVGRVIGTPIAQDGLLYVGDLGGTLHCLDTATGAQVWKHETHGAIWGCLLLAGDRLYLGNVDGFMTVLRAGRRKEVLAQIEMDAPLYSHPAAAGDALYLATAHRLYFIAAKP
jgi:outer membrane protein assembly factor BamB/HEAT repeat protein